MKMNCMVCQMSFFPLIWFEIFKFPTPRKATGPSSWVLWEWYGTIQLQVHERVLCFAYTTRFYSVSEVRMHAWFRPTATRGSQHCYKYDHAWVAKTVREWSWLPQECYANNAYSVYCAVATTSTSTKHTCDCYIVTIVIVILHYSLCCSALIHGFNQPCTGKMMCVVHLELCTVTNAWLKPLYCMWCAWL